jgi:hypothetical protein
VLSLPRAIAKSSHVSAIRAAQLEAAEQRKLKRGLWLGVHTRPKAETGQGTVFAPAFCISHGPAGKVHDRLTAGRRRRTRQPGDLRSPTHEIREPNAVNRPRSALAAFLMATVTVMPAVAQQASSAPPPPTQELCSGCFAYLEFPPLSGENALSSLASAHDDTLPPSTDAQETQIAAPVPSLLAAAKQ